MNSNANATNKQGTIHSIKEEFMYMEDGFYNNIIPIFSILDGYSINNNRFVCGDNVFSDCTQEICMKIQSFSTVFKKDSFTVEDMGFLLNIAHLHRTYRYNINENNTSPLIGRFNSNKKDFNVIFLPYKVGDKKNVLDCLFEDAHVLVCDVSKAKKDIRRIIVTFLCSKLYSYVVNNRKRTTSLHLIVDEAHNYLSAQNIDKEDAIAKTCIETFESIIKEGRKFGAFLTMATQRPSDITATLLSQSHNYVIHKLVNPKDIEIMKNTVPFIDEASITMLSVLAPGQAIFSGTAFNRPNIVQVKFDESTTKVESDTIKLMSNWRRKRNFDEESLMIALKDVDDERELCGCLGWETTIASDTIECAYCGERYICVDNHYAQCGLCFNCGEINEIISCE